MWLGGTIYLNCTGLNIKSNRGGVEIQVFRGIMCLEGEVRGSSGNRSKDHSGTTYSAQGTGS